MGESLKFFNKKDNGFGSIYGSSKWVDEFFVKNHVYDKNVDTKRYIVPTFTENFVKSSK